MRCSAFLAMSLDGCIAGPRGELDWLEVAADPDEDYGFAAFVESTDVVAMGRNTWEAIAAVEELPYRGRPIEVLTGRPLDPRPGVTAVSRTAAECVPAWSELGYERVYVDGGRVVRDFLAAGLLDDLTITVIPVILGSGIRLFEDGLPASRWVFDEVRTWPNGLVQLACTRA